MDYVTSLNCPSTITISSSKVSQSHSEEWKEKLGRYILQYSEDGNIFYENEKHREIYMYLSRQGNWMVGNNIGENFGWIANTKCSRECPSSCPEQSWIYWNGVTGGKGAWKSDTTLNVDGCVKWRQTSQCSSNGPRVPEEDKDCNVEIKKQSGYCECTNGRTEMEKRCELPSYYEYEFNTCEEACAYRGKLDNEMFQTNAILLDQPTTGLEPHITLPKQLYHVNENRGWTCSSVLSRMYVTYEEASKACSNDQQCSFVLDEGCDMKGGFKMCSSMAFVQTSSTDCIFNKEHNG